MKSIPSTVRSLCSSYRAIQTAYCELAQLEGDWPKELNEYLYDEKYGGLSATRLVSEVVIELEKYQLPLQQLALDAQNLESDLIRIGRGGSFEV